MDSYSEQLRHHAPALAALVPAMRRRQLEIPTLDGLSFAATARALHRAAVEEGPWAPLVLLTAPCSAAVLRDMARLAGAGWLASPLPIHAPDCRLLLRAEATLRLPPDALAWLRAQDAHHIAGTDPALERARRMIRVCADQREILTILGPAGSGRRALLAAEAALSGQQLAVITHARPAPGRWWLLEDLEHLPPAVLPPLLERLDRPGAPGHALTGARPDHPLLDDIIGDSAALCAVLSDILRLAPTPQPVLVLGETGTGKERTVAALAALSGRAGPLVTVDPGMLTGPLAVSALFGHEKGSFTGATRKHRGALERADGGTLFLDELDSLSPDVQARLLRSLEVGVIQPLGSEQTVQVDVRVIAASGADLEAMVAAGTFRADLLYRLNGATIRLPPLRERLGDIAALSASLLPRHARLTEAALQALQDYSWPGNIRQLKQVLENAATQTDGAISPAHLQAAGLPLPGPVFLTAEAIPGEPPAGMQHHQLYQATALSVRIASLAERGPQSVRGAILSALSGTPITQDALALLEQWPWWGGLAELSRVLRLLTGQGTAIDRDLLLSLFPRFSAPTNRAPIAVLLHPTLTRSGELVGLRSTSRDAALLIGRAPDLAALLAEGDALSRRRRRWLTELLPESSAAALAFPHLPDLSRAHVLITRSADGLVVHRVPETLLSVSAAALGQPLRPLAPGSAIPVGSAALIEIHRGTAPVLQVYVFLDHDAEQQARLLRPLLHTPALSATRQEQSRRVFVLTAAETALLNDAVQGWLSDSGPLGRHILSTLRTDGGAERLVGYIEGPDPTRYACRLYEHDANRPLLDDLRRRLRADSRRHRLPTAIRKLL